MNYKHNIDIRSEVKNWAKKKFSEIDFQNKKIDQNHLQKIHKCFEELNINDIFMDGSSTEKITKNI